jgi:adenylate kinase family enzyme
MDNGDLVPDAVVIGMIKSKLEKNADAQGIYLRWIS